MHTKSIIELARYRIGAIAYRVTLRPTSVVFINIDADDEWMLDTHPKTIYKLTEAKTAWNRRTALPRLSGEDFQYVVELLTSEPVVEPFHIVDIERSRHTGEFYYEDNNGDSMPESCLFRTKGLAGKEKVRIKRLFASWSKHMAPDLC